MKRKYIVITFAVILTFLAIGLYMDCGVNPIILASYGGQMPTSDIIELVFLSVFLLVFPVLIITSGLILKDIKKIILVWVVAIIVYFFVPVTDLIQGYKGVIEIKQIQTDLPVTIKCNSSFSRIYNIGFPIALEVKNKAITRRKIDVVDYYYNTGKKTSGENRGWDDFNDLYIQEEDSLVKIPFTWEANRYKTLKGLQSLNMVVYTTHKPEIDNDLQKLLQPYLLTMMENDVTTMNIGTIEQLKADNPGLLNILLTDNEIAVINWGKKREKHVSNILKIEY